MAKPTEKPVDDQATSDLQAAVYQTSAPDLLLKFRDKVYTSRTLIIPDTDRTLSVAKGVVEVSASDEHAVSYLKANAEFEPAKE
jgi:hypothetical protein